MSSGRVESGTIEERKARIRSVELATKAYPGLKAILSSGILDADLRQDIIAGLIASRDMGRAQGRRQERGRSIEGADIFSDLTDGFNEYSYRPSPADTSEFSRLNSEAELRDREKRYEQVRSEKR